MKKAIPYIAILLIWIALSLFGNVYQDYDNNLTLNVGRISECFINNETYLYMNNKDKENINKTIDLEIITTTSKENIKISFNGNKKVLSQAITYKGELLEIKADGVSLDFSSATLYSNKILTLFLRYSLISLLISLGIISTFIELYNKSKKKYKNVSNTRDIIKKINEA